MEFGYKMCKAWNSGSKNTASILEGVLGGRFELV